MRSPTGRRPGVVWAATLVAGFLLVMAVAFVVAGGTDTTVSRDAERAGLASRSQGPEAGPDSDQGTEQRAHEEGQVGDEAGQPPTAGPPGVSEKQDQQERWLLSAPLPRSASSLETLANGYPVHVLPLPPSAKVTSSGITSENRTMHATLDAARGNRSAEQVLEHYRRLLLPRGFTESKAPAVGGSTAREFARFSDSVLVTVTPASFTVFAVLHAGPER